MKKIQLLLLLLLSATAASAQWAQCDTMTIKLINADVTFKDNIFSSSDSLIALPFINNTSVNMAYPQAKLINTTPLPTGMTLADANWMVFASSWNMGDTATAAIPYNVSAPIPDNYMVTFKVYCKNFAPLAYDSCEFVNTVTVNLKPVGVTGVRSVNETKVLSVYPNPAKDVVYIDGCVAGAVVELYASLGAVVATTTATGGLSVVDISTLPVGVYFLRVHGVDGVRRLVKGW